MLKLDVFFSELKYEAVKQQPAYDLATYFSKDSLRGDVQ